MDYPQIKSILDRLISLLLVVLLLPLEVLLILTLLLLGEGVIFAQLRTGKHGREFVLYKFKTMSDERDQDGRLLPDESRIHPFGKFLRTTSLDELPQLINVLKGEMSLVGPRPLLPEYLPLYNDIHRLRISVKPGITGWAQVKGRNALSWPERFDLDVEYVNRQSFWIDLFIFASTIVQIFKFQEVGHRGHASMPKFSGY